MFEGSSSSNSFSSDEIWEKSPSPSWLFKQHNSFKHNISRHEYVTIHLCCQISGRLSKYITPNTQRLHYPSSIRGLATPWTYFLHLSLSSVILTDSSMGSPVHVFLACMHLALFLALSLSPGNSLVSSWFDHSMLAFLLWQCLTVPSLLQLC